MGFLGLPQPFGAQIFQDLLALLHREDCSGLLSSCLQNASNLSSLGARKIGRSDRPSQLLPRLQRIEKVLLLLGRNHGINLTAGLLAQLF